MGGVTCLLLLLWAGVTVSTVLDLQKRIIGGHDCDKEQRLFHVQIQDGNGEFICGGSLISDRWILTAAHCLVDKLKVVLGVHPGPGTVQNIEKSVTYPGHDIMLLKIPVPSSITPVPLPDCTDTPELGKTVRMAGQGTTTGHPYGKGTCGYSPTLQCADTTVVKCSPYKGIYMFCGKKAKVAACKGDSGGGVLYKDKIYGVIVSGGPSLVLDNQTEFMDVCKFMNWIRDTTKSTLTKIVDKIKACVGCG